MTHWMSRVLAAAVIVALGTALGPLGAQTEQALWPAELDDLDSHQAAAPAQPPPPVRDLAALVREKMALAGETFEQKVDWLSAQEGDWLQEHEAQTLTVADLAAIARAWIDLKQYEKAQSWARRTYVAAVGTAASREKADVNTLGLLARLISDAGLIHSGQRYPEFAEALAGLAQRGALYTSEDGGLSGTPWRRHTMASLLLSPQVRAPLEQELVGLDGKPRIEAALILAWSYRYTRESQPWRALVAQTAEEARDADTQALWLLIKGHADAVAFGDAPQLAWRFTEQAVASAATPAVREQALRFFVALHREMARDPDTAAGLAGIKAGLASNPPAALAAMQEEWRGQVQVEIARDLQWRKQVLLNAYRQELAGAEAKGSARQLQYLQGCVDRIEKELAATPTN
jgi:hypothetical protein